MQLMQHVFIQSFIIYTYISLKDIVDTVLDTVDAILLNAVFLCMGFLMNHNQHCGNLTGGR